MSKRRQSSGEDIDTRSKKPYYHREKEAKNISHQESSKRKLRTDVDERTHISTDEDAEKRRHTRVERISVKKERCDTEERSRYSNQRGQKDVISESWSDKSRRKNRRSFADSDDEGGRAAHSHRIKTENDVDEYSEKRPKSEKNRHFNGNTDRDRLRDRTVESRYSDQESRHSKRSYSSKGKRSVSRGENEERTRRQHCGNGNDDRLHGETSRWREHSGSDDERENRNRRVKADPDGPVGKKRRRDSDSEREERQSNHFRRNNDHPKYGWGKPDDEEKGKQDKKPVEKEKRNFEKSGKLTEHTNTFRGVVIKYNEPKEARIPKRRWRFHPYKGDEALSILHLHRQSAYLIGRNRKIADIPFDHPSISQQHAVLQYRSVPYQLPNGRKGRRVWPYIIDLGSSNGTFINNEKIKPQRYVELHEQDVLKFGFSTREYVVLHENSANGLDFSDDEKKQEESEEEEEEEEEDEK